MIAFVFCPRQTGLISGYLQVKPLTGSGQEIAHHGFQGILPVRHFEPVDLFDAVEREL